MISITSQHVTTNHRQNHMVFPSSDGATEASAQTPSFQQVDPPEATETLGACGQLAEVREIL